MAGERLPALDCPVPQLRFTADHLDVATSGALINGKRQTPVALLRNHPIVHVGEPVELPIKAKARVPGDLPSDIHHWLPEVVHGDEPFVNEPEHQVRTAAPADRI